MGKVCWINGQPYLVSLPRGGRDENDHNNQWDEMIAFLGRDSNRLFHWEWMYSWCQDAVDTSSRAIRGFNSARIWRYYNATYRDVCVGFRPVLMPLDSDTLKPDVSLLEDIPNGTRIALASLYIGGKVIAEPQDPTWNGDIVVYTPGEKITLGDRDQDSKNWLHVVKYKDFLWLDRNILAKISWVDLREQGFTGEN